MSEAFIWIVKLLKQNNICFQITGGFAARLYGSARPLFDLDIDVENFDKILPFVKEFIKDGPRPYREDGFDIELLTLEYDGQRIDLSRDNDVDFDNYTEMVVFGEIVPVIKREDLIEYKKHLGRPEDIVDIKEMTLDNNNALR